MVAHLLGRFGGEDQRLAVVAQLGLQFEEGLVDRAQFLGLHRAPVDGDHAGLVGKPGQAIERLHEGAVAQPGGFEVGQPVLGEEAAEGGQREGGLAMREGAEDDLHPLVAVMVFVPGGGAVALLAQRLQRIALGVEGARLGLGPFGVEEVPVLGHHQEDQAVDETQELVEPFGQVHFAGMQFRGQVGVGLEETRAEQFEGQLDLTGQAITRGFALLGASIAPAFEGTIGGRGICRAEAGAVDQQPEHREGRDVLVGEHLRQIGLDIGRTGQRGIVRA